MILDAAASLKFNRLRSADEQPHYPIGNVDTAQCPNALCHNYHTLTGLNQLFQLAPFDWSTETLFSLGVKFDPKNVTELYHRAEVMKLNLKVSTRY